MRIEILRGDDDPLVIELWKVFYPIRDGTVLAFMSNDLGKYGNQRGLVISFREGLKTFEIPLVQNTQVPKPFNPSCRIQGEK